MFVSICSRDLSDLGYALGKSSLNIVSAGQQTLDAQSRKSTFFLWFLTLFDGLLRKTTINRCKDSRPDYAGRV